MSKLTLQHSSIKLQFLTWRYVLCLHLLFTCYFFYIMRFDSTWSCWYVNKYVIYTINVSYKKKYHCIVISNKRQIRGNYKQTFRNTKTMYAQTSHLPVEIGRVWQNPFAQLHCYPDLLEVTELCPLGFGFHVPFWSGHHNENKETSLAFIYSLFQSLAGLARLHNVINCIRIAVRHK